MMSGLYPIDQALTHPELLGAALGDPAPWKVWSIVLKAAFGLPVTSEESEVFRTVAGDRGLPLRRVRELWAVAGRRSGKSRIAAAIAVHQALFVQHRLSEGEVGHVLVLAASRDQAQTVFEYCLGFVQASPVLRAELLIATQDEIRLRNNVVIAIHGNSYRNVRGKTLVACIFDETAYWRDDTSAVPDVEVYRACLPSLSASGGMLVAISSPYRKVGLLHQKHRDSYGVDGDVLVVQAPTSLLNPTLDPAAIAAATEADPEGATSEWGAEFRADISTFLDDADIDGAVDFDRPMELPRRADTRYVAFCDPSGGKRDSFTICVGHREGERDTAGFVADVVRAVKPPLDPIAVAQQYAELLRAYGVREVIGDRYSAAWVFSAFRDAGIKYLVSKPSASELYLEALPLFSRRHITIPNHAPLLRELRLLERTTHRSGRDTVTHPRNAHDDLANSLCGCAAFAMKRGEYNLDALADSPEFDYEAAQAGRAERHKRQVEKWRTANYDMRTLQQRERQQAGGER
jgi:terminase large subunit-like protein